MKGLLTLLPLAITIFVMVWLVRELESLFGKLLQYILPASWYLPGMGVAVGLTAIFLVGLVLQAWFIRKIWRSVESLLEKMPLVSEFYGFLKQLIGFLSGEQRPKSGNVVMVEIGDSTTRLLGLVPREDFQGAPTGMGDDETVAVFLPWGYQLGGFTVYAPRTKMVPVDMSTEEALRWALTAGMYEKEAVDRGGGADIRKENSAYESAKPVV